MKAGLSLSSHSKSLCGLCDLQHFDRITVHTPSAEYLKGMASGCLVGLYVISFEY